MNGKIARTVAAALLLGSSVALADFNAGLRAFDSGNYARAYKEWYPLASDGNTDAQNNLGWMYEYGLGVDVNMEVARSWYEKAAGKSELARKNLERVRATLAQRDTPTAPATRKVEIAGDFNDGLAAYDAGNFESAFTIWLSLARDGNAHAQNNIGWMYENGQGVATDQGKALDWYRQAAAADPRWQENYDRLRSASTRSTATSTAAAKVPQPPAAGTFDDGLSAYDRGDFATALQIWLPLAEQNQVDAQNNLGWMYENGQGVEQNYPRALQWYQRAASQDPRWQTNVDRVLPLAQTQIASTRSVKDQDTGGLTVQKIDALFKRASASLNRKDYQDAFKVFSELAEAGDARSQTNLGYLYYNGLGTTRDTDRARDWYERAAKQGEMHAQNNLGTLLASGDTGPVDYVEAYKWFSLAEASGHAAAARNRLSLETLMTPRELEAARTKLESINGG